MELLTQAPEQTEALGRWLGARLWPGSFLALVGDLGAGKSALAAGVLAGLGVQKQGGSPTFPLLWEYRGSRLPAYHWDVYRVQDPGELEAVGALETFAGDGVCIVEWADRVRELWPEEYLLIELEHAGPGARRIRLEPHGARYTTLVEELRRADLGL